LFIKSTWHTSNGGITSKVWQTFADHCSHR